MGDTMKRVPIEKPPFTLSQIKKAIPPHFFQRSVLRSFSYLIYDLTIAFCLYYIATDYFHNLPHPLTFLAWPIYWAVQGFTLAGLWVIAHDCGHHAFRDYQLLDDNVGLVLHSALLVPYFSWKYSHRRHHSNTGSLERDEVFVPKQKSSIKWLSKYLNNPPGRVFTLAVTITLGWPMYLTFNVSCSMLWTFSSCQAKGLAWVVYVYGFPMLVVNGCWSQSCSTLTLHGRTTISLSGTGSEEL